MTGKALKAFIEAEAARRNLKLRPGMSDELARAFDGDSWSIITELDKLSLMDKQALDFDRPPQEYYELINAIKYGRDVRHKMVALELILSDRKDDAARVFNTLAYRLGGYKRSFIVRRLRRRY